MRLQLTNQGNVKIDQSCFSIVSKHGWFLTSGGYAATNIKGLDGKFHQVLMHRFLMGDRNDKEIDHVNNDRLDNRISNLRWATRQENIRNKKKSLNKSSIYNGVHWENRRKRWMSSISILGKRMWLGQFLSEKEAALAYNSAARRLFGNFANLNAE